jgi:hypothetical protein
VRRTLVLASVALAACSGPHQFEIKSDERITGVEVNLENMRWSQVRLINDNHATAEARTADSSGEIRVTLSDGREVVCPVGYVTSGDDEPHNIIVRNGRCSGV